MDIDKALEKLGGFRGRWQLLCFTFLSGSMMIPACLIILNIVFIGLVPEHHCTVAVNASIPQVEKDGKWMNSECLMYAENGSSVNETVPCLNGWTYENLDDIGWTIVAEFDLVCDRSFLVSLTQTLLVAGMTLGSIFVAPLPDKFGRKPVLIVALSSVILVTVAMSFTQHYLTFAILRVVSGFCLIGLLSAISACVELFPASSRGKAGILLQLPWTIGMLIMLLMGYYLRYWRHYLLACGLIPSVLMLGYWVYPESIPWLVSQGRYEEAERILRKAAATSGVHLPDVILNKSNSINTTTSKNAYNTTSNYTSNIITNHTSSSNTFTTSTKQKIRDSGRRNGEGNESLVVMKHAVLRKHAAIMCAAWFCNSLVYYGISFLSVSWAGNRFVNFFLNALVEIPAIAICLLTLEKFGRRLPICVFHIGAGLSLLISVFIPEKFGDTSLIPLSVALNIIAKTFITSSFDAIWLYTPELFPTTVRSTGIGFAQFGARAGAMIAPFSTLLASKIPWLPGLIFSMVAFIIGGLILLLPETLHRPLAQTVFEMKSWRKESSSYTINTCCRTRLDEAEF